MPTRTLIFVNLFIFMATACAASQPLAPDVSQQILLEIWRMDRHIVWELNWPAAPISGPLTVETWQSGNRYRFEILESPASALMGETLVFDGQNAWRYNRFRPPAAFTPTTAVLSPLSDAFLLIDTRLGTTPQTATQESAQVNFSPAKKITATYPNGDRLTLWQDAETGLPAKIEFLFGTQKITLQARHAEYLLDPPNELFSVGNWVY